MDNVVLCLSLAIAIILVLLMCSCGGDSKRKRSCGSRRRAHAHHGHHHRDGFSSPIAEQNAESDNRYNDLKDLSDYEDYNQVAQYMSVEPSVYESHNLYSSDMNRSTSGPSMLAERDDPNDVVPWMGLRKPKYREVYSRGIGLSQESSEHPDQMRKNNTYVIG